MFSKIELLALHVMLRATTLDFNLLMLALGSNVEFEQSCALVRIIVTLWHKGTRTMVHKSICLPGLKCRISSTRLLRHAGIVVKALGALAIYLTICRVSGSSLYAVSLCFFALARLH